MKHTLLLLFLLLSAYMGHGQKQSFAQYWEPHILSNKSLPQLKTSIAEEHFRTYREKQAVPATIVRLLESWENEAGDKEYYRFRLADPSEPYNATDVVDRHLPERQLVRVWKNKQHMILVYKHGGFGLHYHLLWAATEGKKIKDIWIGVSTEELKDLASVKTFLDQAPEELNTNIVCF